MSPIVAFCITEALQYGPDFVKSVIAAFQKPNPTIADIEVLFAGVKPYSAYNIPDKAITTSAGSGLPISAS